MGEERRKYYRYPPSGGSETVVMRHAGVERGARLVNLSSEGFRVDVEADSIVEVGDIVLLATNSGFHRVEVVNVARDNGMLQLGLKRLQDIPASAVEALSDEKPRPGSKSRRTPLATLAQLGVPAAVSLTLFAAVAWTWTSDVDPADSAVGEKLFNTPKSRYAARHRTGTPDEETTASRENRSLKQSYAAADDGPGSQRKARGSRLESSADLASRDESGRSSQNASDSSGDANVGRRSEASAESSAGSAALPNAPSAGGTIFDSQADASRSIDSALKTAKRENKRVLVEFGGNSCESCNELHSVFTQDSEIAGLFQKKFVLVPVDMEANQHLVSRYVADESRVPFLALLDKYGNILKRHKTQEFEAGSKLDLGKIKAFLQRWASAG
jgi:thioredoxin 1